MKQSALAAQPIPNVVRSITADDSGKAAVGQPALSEMTRKFAHANFRKAFWQLLDTSIPYGVLWALMLHSMQQGYPYWLTLTLAVVAAAILVRIFYSVP